MFNIIDTISGAVLYSKVSQENAETLSRKLKSDGIKARIVKIVDERDPSTWHTREANRLANGRYRPLPKSWTQERWFKNTATEFHFAHAATDGLQVSYTQDDIRGFMDRQTVLAPSRYLAKYYPNLRSEEISKLAAVFSAGDHEVEFGSTEDAFVFAFVQKDLKNTSSSYNSCMGYSAAHFHVKKHPSTVYAAGDLGIAFIRDKTNPKTVLARAIVWPEKKLSNRAYGTNERMREIMNSLLESHGYQHITSSKTFEGARLQKIDVSKESRCRSPHRAYLMPYIDGDAHYVTEEDDFFVLCKNQDGLSSNTNVQSQSGYVICPKRLRRGEITCSYCGDITAEGVEIVTEYGASGQRWCPRCRTEYAVFCEITDTWRCGFAIDNVLVATDENGHRSYIRGWIEHETVEECFRTGEFFCTTRFGSPITVINAEGSRERICSAFRLPTDIDYVKPVSVCARLSSNRWTNPPPLEMQNLSPRSNNDRDENIGGVIGRIRSGTPPLGRTNSAIQALREAQTETNIAIQQAWLAMDVARPDNEPEYIPYPQVYRR